MASDDDSDDMKEWAKLDTITTFEWQDKYSKVTSQTMTPSPDNSSVNTESSTKLVDNTPSFKENFIESLATQPTAPISLLIESLVQQLCSMIEPDKATSHQLYQTICQQLYRMHLIDETFALGEFDVMRSQYQEALYQLATVARGESDVPLNVKSVWPLTDSASLSLSRYHRDFEELGFIADGGFGSVYRARNKLDGIEYAVKKVNIKYLTKNRVMSHLDEVKTFASLNHSNIVPYKAAWLEPSFGTGTATNRPNAIDKPKTATTSAQKVQKQLLNITNNGFEKGVTFLGTETETKFSEATNDDDDDEETDSEFDSSDSDVMPNRQNTAKKMSHLKLPADHNNDESSDFIQFKSHTLDGDDDAAAAAYDDVDGANLSRVDSVKERSDRKKKALIKKDDVPNGVAKDVTNGDLGIVNEPHLLKLKWATLYIQMAFRKSTLRNWLDKRNKIDDFDHFYRKFVLDSVKDLDRSVAEVEEIPSTSRTVAPINSNDRIVRRRASSMSLALEKQLSDPFNIFDVAMNIFVQALNGLRYIHLHNIVHHDIKPSNIFIGCEKNGELYVQVGDFGLACPLDSKHSKESMIGTPTYAAPEQLKGHCNPKSDVFSLGLILLELLIPFKTYMERSETFEAARKGKMPDNLPSKYVELLQILLQDYKNRPDTTQTFEYLKKINLLNDDILFLAKNQNEKSVEVVTNVSSPPPPPPAPPPTPSICATKPTSNVETELIDIITSIACKNTTQSTTLTSAFMASSRKKHVENEMNVNGITETHDYADRKTLKAMLESKLSERLKKEMDLNELDDEIQKIRDEIDQISSKSPSSHHHS